MKDSKFTIEISKKTLRKLLKLRTDSSRRSDLKNKLEILAVKQGLKPAFLELFPHKRTDRFKRLAILLGLRYRETKVPHPHFLTKPNVKSSFLKALENLTSAGGSSTWIYSLNQVESMISQCIKGKLNEGYILGYPECCIKWHEKQRVPEIESYFQDIEEYISRNPTVLNNVQTETEEELYSFILLRLQNPFPSYALETVKQFPFVPHWSCPSCLSGKSQESEKLNTQYERLAIDLDPKFAQEIIQESQRWVRQHQTE